MLWQERDYGDPIFVSMVNAERLADERTGGFLRVRISACPAHGPALSVSLDAVHVESVWQGNRSVAEPPARKRRRAPDGLAASLSVISCPESVGDYRSLRSHPSPLHRSDPREGPPQQLQLE